MDAERFGPYRLERRIGAGGMGEVWRALDTEHADRAVAVKLLPRALADDADFDARFRRESRLASRLRSPHVVPIHTYGEIDGRLFIDMQLVDGVDLSVLLTRDGPLAPGRAVAVVEQVADALDAAHDAGLVHRDVKPGNVRLAGPGGFVYLLDFGLAAPLHEATSLTAAGDLVGTFQYMAPERFRPGRVDRRCDVYALGALLYACLTGRHPFVVDDLPTAMYAHLQSPPPAVTAIRVDAPAALDLVVATAMAKAPEDRYPTASALASAARAALDPGGPGSAPATATPATPAAPAAPAAPATGTDASQEGESEAAAPRRGEPQDAVATDAAPEDAVATRPRRRRRAVLGALAVAGVVGAGVATGIAASRDDRFGELPVALPGSARSRPQPLAGPAPPTVIGPGQVVRVPLSAPLNSPPSAAAVAPDGRTLIVLCERAGIETFVPLDGDGSVVPALGSGRPTDVAISPDGRLSCLVDYDLGRLSFGELGSGGPRDSVALPPGARYAEFSRDSRQIFVVDESARSVFVVDVAARRAVARWPEDGSVTPFDSARTTALALSPDGSVLVVVSPDGTVLGFDTSSGGVLWVTTAGDPYASAGGSSVPITGVGGAAVSPDDERVYVATASEVAALRDGSYVGGAKVAGAGSVAASPDGRRLYLGLPATNSIVAVDPAAAYRVVGRTELGGSGLGFVLVSPDGRRLYTSDASTGDLVILGLG